MINNIFDFDGTLISELKINYLELKNELKKILNINVEITPMIDKINEYSNCQIIKKKCFDLIDKYEIDALNNSKINESIIELYLNSKYKIIVSRNGFNVIDFFFKNNNIPYPDLICCRDNCEKLKPNIEHLTLIFEKYSDLNNTNICIVGDSWHDTQLSKNINCKYLHSDTYYNS
jgi:phosphoglycolate phosphatase-like HAD superfamily hydrolase